VRGRSFVGRIGRDAALYGTAGVLGKAAALVTVPYLSRSLGPSGYGLADLATSFAAIMTLVLMFAGDIPTMRMVGRGDRNFVPRALSSFVAATGAVSLVGAVLMLPISTFIASDLWSAPDAVPVAIVAISLIPVSAAQASLVHVLRMSGRPRAFAMVATCDLFAQLLFAIGLVAFGLGPLGVVVGFLIGSGIGLAVALVVALPNLHFRPDFSLAIQIIREGLPFLPSVAAFVLADVLARSVAANALGVASVGQIAVAIRVASVMALASSAFSLAWGPLGLAMSPDATTKVMYERVLRLQLLLVGTVAVAVGCLAPEITALLAGSNFLDAATVVPGLLLSSGLAAVLYVLATAAAIGGQDRWVASSHVIGAALQVAAVAILLPTTGIGGFAMASLAGRYTGILILGLAVRRIARVTGSSIVVVILATGGVLLAQAMNAVPGETRLLRYALSLGCLVAGSWALARSDSTDSPWPGDIPKTA
jgi:O-antigen/teichoic acid export membrane protein